MHSMRFRSKFSRRNGNRIKTSETTIPTIPTTPYSQILSPSTTTNSQPPSPPTITNPHKPKPIPYKSKFHEHLTDDENNTSINDNAISISTPRTPSPPRPAKLSRNPPCSTASSLKSTSSSASGEEDLFYDCIPHPGPAMPSQPPNSQQDKSESSKGKEGDGKEGNEKDNNGGMEDSWVFTDGEEVDGDDWDECKDAVAMVQRQREMERAGGRTFNGKVRDVLLGMGGRGGEKK